MNQKDERNWGTFIHLGGILGTIVLSSVGNIILVLVLWLIKRNESKFVDDQGKEALNFQITISIASAAVTLIGNILNGFWSLGNFFMGFGMFHGGWSWYKLNTILWVINVIFSIIAAVKANEGVGYKYPLSLRLVK